MTSAFQPACLLFVCSDVSSRRHKQQKAKIHQRAFIKNPHQLTSATSGRPRDWKESWELQSRRLGPSRAVPLEGPEGVRVVRLPLSGETMLAERKKERDRETVNRGDSTKIESKQRRVHGTWGNVQLCQCYCELIREWIFDWTKSPLWTSRYWSHY